MTARFLTPAVRLVAGRTVADSRDAVGSTLADLEVALSLDTSADSVTARLAGVERNPPQLGDAVTLQLGYTGDDLTGVFTGTVARVEIEPQSIRLIAHGAAASLLALTVDRTYTSVTAADAAPSRPTSSTAAARPCITRTTSPTSAACSSTSARTAGWCWSASPPAAPCTSTGTDST